MRHTDSPDTDSPDRTEPDLEDVEPAVEAASVEIIDEDEGGALVPSRGLLSFYDRLRARVVETVERRGGELGGKTVEALLLVPDVFILLLRLSLDRDVPASTRMLLGGALAYFVVPVDFLPEAFLGPAGFVDDLVLAMGVLSEAFGHELEPYARKYWSGKKALRVVLRDVLEASKVLVGYSAYDRLRAFLAKKGVDLDRSVEEASPEPSA